MIGYAIVFAVGLFLGAIAGVAVAALCVAASERRALLRTPKDGERENVDEQAPTGAPGHHMSQGP